MGRMWLIGCSLILALVLVASGCAPKEAPTKEAVNLEWYAASPIVATPYQVALAISEMLKEHPWLRASVVPGKSANGAIETSDALPPERRSLSFVAGTCTPAVGMVWEGMEPFARKYTDIKLVMTLRHGTYTFVTYDPEIKTGQDFIGKNVGLYPMGSSPTLLGAAVLRDAWGIWDKVTVSHHLVMDHKDLLVTNIIDVAFAGTVNKAAGGKWMVTGQMPPLVTARKSYWIQNTEEDVRRINAANPFTTWLVKVPKDAAGKDMPPEDTNMLAFNTLMMCWDTVDEAIVYELVKFIDENRDNWELRTMNSGGAEFLADFGAGYTEANVHPGALRYYKEKGISIGC